MAAKGGGNYGRVRRTSKRAGRAGNGEDVTLCLRALTNARSDLEIFSRRERWEARSALASLAALWLSLRLYSRCCRPNAPADGKRRRTRDVFRLTLPSLPLSSGRTGGIVRGISGALPFPFAPPLLPYCSPSRPPLVPIFRGGRLLFASSLASAASLFVPIAGVITVHRKKKFDLRKPILIR